MKSNDNHNHKVTDMNSKTTRVLSIDMGQEVVDFLRKENLETYDGTFGPFVDARNVDYCWDRLPIYLEQDLPDNLHEYSVVIEDLGFERKTISYDLEQIDKQKAIADTDSSFKSLCLAKPINVFDPVPFCCFLLKSNFETKKGELIKIIFQAPKYEVQYSGIRMSNNIHSIGVFSNYQNIVDFTQKSLSGDRVKLVNEYRLSEILFSGLENQLSYSQTFFHPSIPKNGIYDTEPNPHFIPLLLNEQGDIISYVYFEKKTCTFVLPQIENKVVLLERLFTNCLYRNFSELFPLQTKNTWLTKKEYELPEIVQLCEEKEEARQIYENTIEQKDKSIAEIRKKYNFLYAMLTETGDSLVNNVKQYLEWLGFDNVQSMDEEVKEGEDFQEDLQIHLANNELLIIEVKGLHGTSKDNECSQISKIELRRIHERKYSNVYALYIVNNERGKEPLKRQMPPFTETQIKDAEFAHRAMAYTYQLFNLYFEIETGIISKEEARNALFQNGLVNFRSNFKSIGKPYDYFKNNKVACIELHDTILSVGDKVYFEDDRKRLNVVEIVNIQVDRQNKQVVKDGKVGIEFTMKIPKGAVLLYKYL
jgi:hypothetical protein